MADGCQKWVPMSFCPVCGTWMHCKPEGAIEYTRREEAPEMMNHARYVRYVNYHWIEDYLRMGWVVMIPTTPHHPLDAYGVMMAYLCECHPNARPI